MSNNGIMRKIDELGRVVIPVEIRKYLNIKNGENIEFTIDNDVILLQKKSSSKQNLKVLEDIERVLCSVIDGDYIITDRDKVLFSSNKELVSKNLTSDILKNLNQKEEYTKLEDTLLIKNTNLYLFLYSFDNNVAGFIILYNINDINKYIKLVKFISLYLNEMLSIS